MGFARQFATIAGTASLVVALGCGALGITPSSMKQRPRHSLPHEQTISTHIEGLEQAVEGAHLCSSSSNVPPDTLPAPTSYNDKHYEEDDELWFNDLEYLSGDPSLLMGFIDRSSHPALKLDYTKLMTDEEFTESGYVTASEVQKYLEGIGSCLKDSVNGVKFSDEVVRLAEKYSINPMLLLARAQVEKSVVRKKNASPAQLQEIMGYGIPDNGSRADTPKGFAAQLDNAARILRKRFDEFSTPEKLKSIKVNYGTADIVPQNAATYALMRYTPHTIDTKLPAAGGGNCLFRKVLDFFKKDIEPYREPSFGFLEEQDAANNNAPAATTAISASPTVMVVYTVRKGDNLIGIAAKYEGVSVENICAQNNIPNPNTIYVGQVLKFKKSGN